MLGQTGQPPRSVLVPKECWLDVVGSGGALADLCGSPAGYPVLELPPRLGWGAWQGPGTMLQVAIVLQLALRPDAGGCPYGGPCSLQNCWAIMGAMRVDADTGTSPLALPAGVNDGLPYIQFCAASLQGLQCKRPTHPPGQIIPTILYIWPSLCACCII